MENKISIIVPIYNVEKYLFKCLDSILNQTFREFELILVNDGSTDRCGEICEEYSKKDKRIKVIHKHNGGLSSARNAGINMATGEYIAFVDSDDFIDPEMYELLFKYAKETYSEIVLCDYFIVKENEIINTLRDNISIQPTIFTNIEALEQLYKNNNVKFVIACNKLYRRNLFLNLQYEEGRIHEDEFIIHKLFYKCSKVTYLPIKLYFYLQRGDSITRSPFNVKRLDAVYALKARADFFKENNLKDLQQKAEVKYVQILFKNYQKLRINNIIAINEIKKLRKDFFKSIRSLLQNPHYRKKEKAIWLLFIINPFLYDWYIKIRDTNKKSIVGM